QGGKKTVFFAYRGSKERGFTRAPISNFQLFAFTTFTKFSVEQSYSDDYSHIRNEVRQTNRKHS
ncbi:MAG: hypothetical protein D8H91_08040, partial [Alloprevotella sp.]